MKTLLLVLIGAIAYYISSPDLMKKYPILAPQKKSEESEEATQSEESEESKERKEHKKDDDDCNGDHLFPDYLKQ